MSSLCKNFNVGHHSSYWWRNLLNHYTMIEHTESHWDIVQKVRPVTLSCLFSCLFTLFWSITMLHQERLWNFIHWQEIFTKSAMCLTHENSSLLNLWMSFIYFSKTYHGISSEKELHWNIMHFLNINKLYHVNIKQTSIGSHC